MLLSKEGDASFLPALPLRQICLCLSTFLNKDVLYLSSIQFSSFSCFSPLIKIRHFEVFWAGELKLRFARESILFSTKRSFSAFWQTGKLLRTTPDKPYCTMEVSKNYKIKCCLVYCFCWEYYLYAHCAFLMDPQKGGRGAENNFEVNVLLIWLWVVHDHGALCVRDFVL